MGPHQGYTYVALKPHATNDQLNTALESISASLMKESKLVGKESFRFEVQPFNKIILSEEMGFSLGDTGSRGKVWAEITVAFVILLSACFNYTNLSVARSLRRGKEVGVRKVSGAMRKQIFAQFIIESCSRPCLPWCWVMCSYTSLQDNHSAGSSPNRMSFLWMQPWLDGLSCLPYLQVCWQAASLPGPCHPSNR